MKRSILIHGIVPYLILNLISTAILYVFLGALGGMSMAVVDGALDHETFSYMTIIQTMWAVLFLQPLFFFAVWRRIIRKEKEAQPDSPSCQITNDCETAKKGKGCNLIKSCTPTFLFLVFSALYYAAYFQLPDIKINTGSPSNQLLQIVQNIRSLHATREALEQGLNEIALAKDGAIPIDMSDDWKNPTRIESPWGEPVTIRNAPKPWDREAFVITFTKTPKKSCASLVNRVTGNGMDSALSQINVGQNPAVTDLPLTKQQADTLCDQASQDVAFQFKLKV